MLLRRHVAETETRLTRPERTAVALKIDVKFTTIAEELLCKLQWIQKFLIDEQVSFHFSWSETQNIVVDLEANLKSWSLWSLTEALEVELLDRKSVV